MIRFEFDSRSENEAMARVVIAAYLLREDPTLEEMADIKTAVSEAVTNAIIHGYEDTIGRIVMEADIKDHCLWFHVFSPACRKRTPALLPSYQRRRR